MAVVGRVRFPGIVVVLPLVGDAVAFRRVCVAFVVVVVVVATA